MKILTGKSILDQVAYGPLRVYHRQPFQLDFLSHLSSGDEVLRFQAAQRRAVPSPSMRLETMTQNLLEIEIYQICSRRQKKAPCGRMDLVLL